RRERPKRSPWDDRRRRADEDPKDVSTERPRPLLPAVGHDEVEDLDGTTVLCALAFGDTRGEASQVGEGHVDPCLGKARTFRQRDGTLRASTSSASPRCAAGFATTARALSSSSTSRV